jgi:hypothetical protein
MLFQVVWIDQDVVEVNYHIYIDQVMKDIIHEVLKGHRGVCESKWHNKVFEHAVMSAKGGFPFISFSYPHIVIPITEVDFQVDFGWSQLVNKGLDSGDRVAVLSGDLVETSVVDTEAKASIFLLHEEYWTGAPAGDFDSWMNPLSNMLSR